MAELVWTMEAVRCLEEIREYIIHDNPTAAQSVVSGLYTKVQSLKEQIRLGHLFDSISDHEVRELLYGHFRIPYLIESQNRVHILGIYHSAMDIDRIMKKRDLSDY